MPSWAAKKGQKTKREEIRAGLGTTKKGDRRGAGGDPRGRGNAPAVLERSSLPDFFPYVRGLRALDETWRRVAEFAADDWAASDCPDRALALASTLVRVGRLRSGLPPAAGGSTLLADPNQLSARIQRLIEPKSEYQASPRILVPAATWLIVIAVLVALRFPVFHAVHGLLETLAHA